MIFNCSLIHSNTRSLKPEQQRNHRHHRLKCQKHCYATFSVGERWQEHAGMIVGVGGNIGTPHSIQLTIQIIMDLVVLSCQVFSPEQISNLAAQGQRNFKSLRADHLIGTMAWRIIWHKNCVFLKIAKPPSSAKTMPI